MRFSVFTDVPARPFEELLERTSHANIFGILEEDGTPNAD